MGVKKLAVLLHGYPAEENQSTPIGLLLRKMDYELIIPRYMVSEEEFSVEWIKKEIKRLAKNKKPDVLVGISLGGLVLPYLVSDYPEAKLIFLATGTRFKPKLKFAEKAVKMAIYKPVERAVEVMTRIPDSWLKMVYDQVHKAKTKHEKELCDKDKAAIIKAVRTIKPHKHRELARFILNTNTTELLKSILNDSLILSGSDDVLMPPDVSMELAKGLKNSTFKEVKAEHFMVLNQETSVIIKKWLEEVQHIKDEK